MLQATPSLSCTSQCVDSALDIPTYCPHLSSSLFFFQGLNLNVFIPSYMKMTIKNVRDRSISKLSAKTEGEIQLTLNLTGVPEDLSRFIASNTKLQFINGETVILSQSHECISIQASNLLTFTLTGQFPMILQNEYILITPFDQCKISTTISVSCRPFFTEDKKVNIRFNLMDSQMMEDKLKVDLLVQSSEFRISHKNQQAYFTSSEFDVTAFTQSDLTLEQRLDRSKSFHYANYSITQYRLPGITILTFYLPMWIFAILNLSIFYSNPELSERITELSTLLLAAIAFMPFLRERLSFSSTLTLPDINFYFLLGTCLIGLYESISIRTSHPSQFKFDCEGNYRFYTCLCIWCISMLIVIVMYIVHKLHWQPKYSSDIKDHKQPKSDSMGVEYFNEQSTIEQSQSSQRDQIIREHWMQERTDIGRWGNRECDMYFSKLVGSILPIRYLKLQG